MDIQKYAGYFHDGSVHNIKHQGDIIYFSLESAELLSEWKWDREKFPLSKRESISGKLHVRLIKNIYYDAKPFHSLLKMIYENGELFELNLREGKVQLLIKWKQYFPKKLQTDIHNIEIEAEKIYWENIPTAYDALWDALDQKTD